jgi:hypothetical protein
MKIPCEGFVLQPNPSKAQQQPGHVFVKLALFLRSRKSASSTKRSGQRWARYKHDTWDRPQMCYLYRSMKTICHSVLFVVCLGFVPSCIRPDAANRTGSSQTGSVPRQVKHLVGVDPNGVAIRQVEWLFEKDDGSGVKEFFWAGAEVRPLETSKHGFTRVSVPRHAFPKGHPLAKPGGTNVVGWIRSQSIVPIVKKD